MKNSSRVSTYEPKTTDFSSGLLGDDGHRAVDRPPTGERLQHPGNRQLLPIGLHDVDP